MSEFIYKTEIVENFANDAATEVILNSEGANGWEATQITYQPNGVTGKSNATVVYKKTS